MSDDGEPSGAELLRIEAKREGSKATIVLVGEFDITGTEQFWTHISQAVEARPVSVTIEGRGLTFIDSAGLAAMVRAHEAATEAGIGFRLSEPSPPVCRLIEIFGLESLLLHE
jgi:anti-sigma B factor antagonist